MPTRNVNLTDHFDNVVEAGATSDRFHNAREMVREGLRLQQREEYKAKVEWLRTAAEAGFAAIERGDYFDLRSGEDVEGFIRQIGKEVSAEIVAEKKRV